MPDTLLLDLDVLKAPENRDRIMQVERLLRAIAYSTELNPNGIVDPGDGSMWGLTSGTKITMRRDKGVVANTALPDPETPELPPTA